MRAWHCIFWGLVVKAESTPEISSKKRFYAGLCKLNATMGVRPQRCGAFLHRPKAQVRKTQELIEIISQIFSEDNLILVCAGLQYLNYYYWLSGWF